MKTVEHSSVKSKKALPIIGIESEPEEPKGRNKDVRSRISLAAYYKAQARGFAPGHELEDWLAAEAEILQ